MFDSREFKIYISIVTAIVASTLIGIGYALAILLT